jgi:hypothetical protein
MGRNDKDVEFTRFRKNISKMGVGKVLKFVNIEEKVFTFTLWDLGSLVGCHLD